MKLFISQSSAYLRTSSAENTLNIHMNRMTHPAHAKLPM